jgi:tRNA modification GTPase
VTAENSPYQPGNPTIAAMASAPGPAQRGIIRVSGAEVLEVVEKIIAGNCPEIHPRFAQRYECQLRIADGDLQLPASLYVWPTSRSFTGEPLVEIHTIGSPPLLNEILERIYTSGARPAERGEFTLRAFLAGRIDLVQAEAVLGVIDAPSHEQLQTALDQLAGGISNRIGSIREELLLHLADLEAGLDFVEEDIDFVQRPVFLERLSTADQFLSGLIQQSSDRMQSTGSYRVVLAGLPNAGKSTLFNALIDSETAIVSPIAGTTRDYLVAEVSEANGLRYELIDTAGWETARDGIESLAGELRTDQYERADMIVWCSAADFSKTETLEDEARFQECQTVKSELLRIMTKADCSADSEVAQVAVSAFEVSSVEKLRSLISSSLNAGNRDEELIGSTAARCQESLKHALESVRRARELVDMSAGDELVSMELRDVLDHLGRIVGVVYTDDILDRIFSRFCIGK